MAGASTQGWGGVVSFNDYVRIAHRRALSLLLGVLLGLTAGVLWYATAPETYRAQATVTITPITNELFSATPVNQLVNTATETTIMSSTEVATRASELSGIDEDPRDLLGRLEVSVPLNAHALDLVFTADTPERATAGANGFANAYLEFRRDAAEQRRETYARSLQGTLDRLTRDIAALPEGSEERDVLGQQAVGLRQQLAAASSLTITPGHLMSEALPPRRPASPRLILGLAAGIVLGTMLGVLLAALRERRDDHLHAVDDIADVRPHVAALGPLPGRRLSGRRDSEEVMVAALRLDRLAHPRKPWLALPAGVDGITDWIDALAYSLAQLHHVVLVRHVDEATPPIEPKLLHGTQGLEVRATDAAGMQPDALPRQQPDGRVVVDASGLPSFAPLLGVLDAFGIIIVGVELTITRRRELSRLLDAIGDLVGDRSRLVMLVMGRPTLPARLSDRWTRIIVSRRRAGHSTAIGALVEARQSEAADRDGTAAVPKSSASR